MLCCEDVIVNMQCVTENGLFQVCYHIDIHVILIMDYCCIVNEMIHYLLSLIYSG